MVCVKRGRDSPSSLGNCNTAAAGERGFLRGLGEGGKGKSFPSGRRYKSRNMISPVQQSFNTIFTKREGEARGKKLEPVERGETGIHYTL